MTREGLRATLRRWDEEWEALAPPGRTVPSTWVLACRSLSEGTWIAEVPQVVAADADAVLLGLLRLHRTGDDVAGRVVLRAMMPKAVRMALCDAESALSDYVAALWEQISVYPIERRPRRVAANLALDTLKTVKSLRACRGVPPWHPPGGDPGPDAVAVLDAGLRLGLIDPLTRRTLECVYLQGRSSRAAASELGTSSDAVRWRCSKGVRALRTHALDLMDELAG